MGCLLGVHRHVRVAGSGVEHLVRLALVQGASVAQQLQQVRGDISVSLAHSRMPAITQTVVPPTAIL